MTEQGELFDLPESLYLLTCQPISYSGEPEFQPGATKAFLLSPPKMVPGLYILEHCLSGEGQREGHKEAPLLPRQ